MWIVNLALNRPYTFLVGALLILILSPLVILRTSIDIFPNINIPVVSIVWAYTGLSPQDMEQRITTVTERSLTTTVNGIEHIESQSLNGVAVVKVFFHPGVNVDMAVAQVTAVSQAQLRNLPPGTTPPLIIQYSASSVPILQLATSSKSLSEQTLYDLSVNFIRPALTTVEGAAIPYPYGGKQRVVSVDIDWNRLQAENLIPSDVINAISAQNLILPSGTAKIATLEYNIALNGTPSKIAELNDLPIKTVNGTIIYIRDVAHVRDGYTPQTNVVRQDGVRSTLISIIKNGDNSTLDIVANIKKNIADILPTLPKDLTIRPLFDQSIFVRASIEGVIREGVIAACLTALMILLFLGDWRSTLIIAISIPLSALCSIMALSALGETINIMTLGGLALAVGILVDDATVTIENIDNHLEHGKAKMQAILDGASQIAVPALVSTLCICIVFVPMFMLSGVARYLFIPLAEAVMFAVMASYVLSRTLIPTLGMYLLRETSAKAAAQDKPPGFFARIHHGFEERFEQVRQAYHRKLDWALHHRALFGVAFLGFCLGSMCLLPFLGQDFFPTVDAGEFKLHIRARAGTRIEETAKLCDQIETAIRKEIPADELDGILDNIGLPYSGINLSYSNSGTIGTADADIMVSLKPNHHPTADYERQLRVDLPHEFPGTEFFFQPSDMVSQILNFGLPSPIDIQVVGQDIQSNLAEAAKISSQLRQVPGMVDVHVHELYNQPELAIQMNRSKANLLGITAQQIAGSALVALSGSFQTTPAFWVDPTNGVNYQVVTQVPQYDIKSLQDINNIPVSGANSSQLLENLASISTTSQPAMSYHYNIRPVIDVYAGVQDTDLGSVSRAVDRIVNADKKDLVRGSKLVVRGQVVTMNQSFQGLGFGLIGSIILVYLLMVVNFQSWTEPFIIITALPGALAGISWMLFLTGTTLSVPALMGAVMCIGVATANSILVVTFARERLAEVENAYEAALEAGTMRLRPVIMTATAMIIGMVPMALGLGEGGEQNAPLGRAVIGGLLLATVATLFFVPVVYSLIRSKTDRTEPEPAALPPMEEAPVPASQME